MRPVGSRELNKSNEHPRIIQHQTSKSNQSWKHHQVQISISCERFVSIWISCLEGAFHNFLGMAACYNGVQWFGKNSQRCSRTLTTVAELLTSPWMPLLNYLCLYGSSHLVALVPLWAQFQGVDLTPDSVPHIPKIKIHNTSISIIMMLMVMMPYSILSKKSWKVHWSTQTQKLRSQIVIVPNNCWIWMPLKW